ncbi:hypothetical protein BH11MYX1_BH11MYX1_54020 [soil metagenome]
MSIVIKSLATAGGGLAGYGLHRVIGCRSGACLIWSRPLVATLYGAMLGLMLGIR